MNEGPSLPVWTATNPALQGIADAANEISRRVEEITATGQTGAQTVRMGRAGTAIFALQNPVSQVVTVRISGSYSPATCGNYFGRIFTEDPAPDGTGAVSAPNKMSDPGYDNALVVNVRETGDSGCGLAPGAWVVGHIMGQAAGPTGQAIYIVAVNGPEVTRFAVTDRVVDYSSGTGKVRLDLVVCQAMQDDAPTDGQVGSGGVQASGTLPATTVVIYTRTIRDIGDVLAAARVSLDTDVSYEGSGSGATTQDVVWQSIEGGPMMGTVVCNGPDGEGDFSDNHYWVQVCRYEQTGGLTALAQGGSPTPIIVEVVNLAEGNCQTHRVLPGTVVEFAAHWDQGSGGSSSSDSVQNPTAHYVMQYADQHSCGLQPCLPASSSSSSSSSSESISSSGVCAGVSLTPASQCVPADQDTAFSVQITAPAGTQWALVADANWMDIQGNNGNPEELDGSGDASVTVSVTQQASGVTGTLTLYVVTASGKTVCATAAVTVGCSTSGGQSGSGSGCGCEWYYQTVVTAVSCVNGQIQVTTAQVKVLV